MAGTTWVKHKMLVQVLDDGRIQHVIKWYFRGHTRDEPGWGVPNTDVCEVLLDDGTEIPDHKLKRASHLDVKRARYDEPFVAVRATLGEASYLAHDPKKQRASPLRRLTTSLASIQPCTKKRRALK